MLELLGIVATNLTATVGVPAVMSLGNRVRRSRSNGDGTLSGSGGDTKSLCDKVRQTRAQIRRTDRSGTRLVEIDAIEDESEDTKSFLFRSIDGRPLPAYRPGQHLIVERPASNNRNAGQRCYTLSVAPVRQAWRITVRRQAPLDDLRSFSAWLHRECRVGDRLRVRGPRGSFVLDKAEADKPLVLLSAGVGITPMVSMLQEELSFPRSRSKWWFHQVRDLTNAPLVAELIADIEQADHCRAYIAASRMKTVPKCASKNVRLMSGKLDMAAIVGIVGTTDFHAFLCGPGAWMQAARTALVGGGVPDSQVWEEAFGEAEAEWTPADKPATSIKDASVPRFEVVFEASGKRGIFDSDQSHLLAHAKSVGVSLPAGCRVGHCGTCAVKLLRGKVKYQRPPEAEIADDEILPCICSPESDVAVHA